MKLGNTDYPAFTNLQSLAATLKVLMGGFYLQWKYPNTSRKLTILLFVCLIVYLPIYFLFIARPKQIIKKNNLQLLAGRINKIAVNESSDRRFATITLKEFPETQFEFDKASKTSSDLSSIQKGDSVSISALTNAIDKNQKLISGFELRKGNITFFSLEEYNSDVRKEKTLAKLFLWMAIAFVLIYLFINKTGLLKWINNQLSSADKTFQQEKPHFNEFLDR